VIFVCRLVGWFVERKGSEKGRERGREEGRKEGRRKGRREGGREQGSKEVRKGRMEAKVGEGQRADRRLKINVRVRDRPDALTRHKGLPGEALPQVKKSVAQRPASHRSGLPK